MIGVAMRTLQASLRDFKVLKAEALVGVKDAARLLGVSPSLVYAYVERKQIPHFRMMGRAIRFRISELERWRQQFYINGGINE